MKKTTSRNLSKRLAQYGSLSAAILGIYNANSQCSGIVDMTITAGTTDYRYDMNLYGDNIPEFKFLVDSIGAAVVANNYSGSILGSLVYKNSISYVYPYNLTSGQDINSSQTTWFSAVNYQSLSRPYSSNCYGNWCNVPNNYIGLKFTVGSDIYYGWARLSVIPNGSDSSITIHEFCYNPTPNEGIQAGQQILGVKEDSFNSIKIVAINKTIALFNLPQATDYSVYTMTGKLALDGKITNSSKYTIEANTLSNGIYIIELRDLNSNAVVRKKIVL